MSKKLHTAKGKWEMKKLKSLGFRTLLTITNSKHLIAVHDSWDSMSHCYNSAVFKLSSYGFLKNGVCCIVH